MTHPANAFILSHPELGELPGRKVLDCLFALAPDGSILLFFHMTGGFLNGVNYSNKTWDGMFAKSLGKISRLRL